MNPGHPCHPKFTGFESVVCIIKHLMKSMWDKTQMVRKVLFSSRLRVTLSFPCFWGSMHNAQRADYAVVECGHC